jgi:ABC-2 type transport system ATP-binding protein
MNAVLRLQEVVKTYGPKVAVNRVSFDVPQGSIYGLLGPNGAGKTSLIRIITTITRADSGSVWLNGEPLNGRHPEQIGYMPEERGLYKKMSVGDHLMYLAQLKGLSAQAAKHEIDYWLDKFDIQDWWKKKVEELSKGMQQKIQFIATVVHKPRLLILDEPFSGLDPINSNLIKDEIFELNKQGISIIFSTHRMEQVEAICENIVLINQGSNVLEGAVHDIKQTYKQNLYRFEYDGAFPSDMLSHLDVKEQHSGGFTIQLPDASASNALLRAILDAGVHLNLYKEILPSLNEIFIQRVGDAIPANDTSSSI